jgi:hypothetical protein
MLSAAFDRVVRYGQLGVDPAELAEPLVFKRGDPDPPSPAEAAALRNAGRAERDRGTFLWLSMVTGYRRGEMVAPRWTHVDLDRGTLGHPADRRPRSGAAWAGLGPAACGGRWGDVIQRPTLSLAEDLRLGECGSALSVRRGRCPPHSCTRRSDAAVLSIDGRG